MQAVFWTERVAPGEVAFKGGRNGGYCQDTVNGVLCNANMLASAPGLDSVFLVEEISSTQVALRAKLSGLYCADTEQGMLCNRNYAWPGDWEVYTVENVNACSSFPCTGTGPAGGANCTDIPGGVINSTAGRICNCTAAGAGYADNSGCVGEVVA
eukprot:gene12872-12998_t